jgi:Catalytic LigB subunit of aromatic ring-opening dioxygenase
MAEIVLGIGTSHGPMLTTPPHQWGERVKADRKNPAHHFKGKTFGFDELVALRADEGLAAQIEPDVWEKRHAACQAAIAQLADVFAAAKPDVAVIVGNDQTEMFTPVNNPAFAVYWGETIENHWPDAADLAKREPGVELAMKGRIPPEGATYPGLPELGRHIIRNVMADNFDVASLKGVEKGVAAFPHAYSFVYRQIMRDKVVPNVPVALNTFYPPNQPSVRRCYDFGKSLVRAIKSWDSDARVALIASGGLTHFVIDETVDQLFFDALRKRDITAIADLGEPIFQAGTSELKNWVPVAGAMADLGYKMTLVDYVPCYRSLAGTGNAMGFVHWLP